LRSKGSAKEDYECKMIEPKINTKTSWSLLAMALVMGLLLGRIASALLTNFN